MITKPDLDILSLDWVSRTMGAHLDLENVSSEIIRRFKKEIPAKKIRLFLWDKSKRKLILAASTAKQPASRNLFASKEMLQAIASKEPLFVKSGVLIPLRRLEESAGLLELSEKKVFLDNKEKVLELAGFMAVALANTRLFMESEIRTQDMFRFNVLSRALNPTIHDEEIVKILLEGLSGIIKFDIAGLLVLSKQSQKLFMKSSAPISRSVVNAIKTELLELTENLTKKSLDADSIDEVLDISQGQMASRKINSHMDAPLITKGKFIGVLKLCSFAKENFSARDAQNISSLVSHGAVAFENAMLYQDLRRTYFSIIRALTSAIEAKDEYTQGHSVLVSKYSASIAVEMGLSASIIESIQIAGILHDLGKIGVPEEILVKKGKLTDNEYGIVKTHPDIAIKILGPVEFPHFSSEEHLPEAPPELTLNLFEGADLSSEVKLMIYHHHEKYAGGGYPRGIKGEEIPLGARILSVADTFEALTANRPYRKAFSTEEAIKVLRQISGEQLDPKIVDVFVKVIKDKGLETLRAQAGI
jgi:HD-GYP domain-containing protein (c-di-GMP phosphodiesterase class II)